MKTPIEVPKEWIEGLIRAGNFNPSQLYEELKNEKIIFLLGYIKSAESFLKQ